MIYIHLRLRHFLSLKFFFLFVCANDDVDNSMANVCETEKETENDIYFNSFFLWFVGYFGDGGGLYSKQQQITNYCFSGNCYYYYYYYKHNHYYYILFNIYLCCCCKRITIIFIWCCDLANVIFFSLSLYPYRLHWDWICLL